MAAAPANADSNRVDTRATPQPEHRVSCHNYCRKDTCLRHLKLKVLLVAVSHKLLTFALKPIVEVVGRLLRVRPTRTQRPFLALSRLLDVYKHAFFTGSWCNPHATRVTWACLGGGPSPHRLGAGVGLQLLDKLGPLRVLCGSRCGRTSCP